jgi:hypothetical protein
MAASPASDPILQRFRAAIDESYDDRIERVILYGSWARGDARADSDYDIALFLRDPASFWVEMGPLSEIEPEALEMSARKFAAHMRVPRNAVSGIMNGTVWSMRKWRSVLPRCLPRHGNIAWTCKWSTTTWSGRRLKSLSGNADRGLCRTVTNSA